LRSRDATGRGQHVDIGLFDSVLALLTYQAGRFFATGESPHRTGNRHLAIAPYDSFQAKDGMLVLAVGNDDQWRRFCGALGLTALAADARFVTNDRRVVDYPTLRPLIEAATREQPLDRLVSALRDVGVPCGATRSIADALADPQAIARAMIETIDHPTAGVLNMLGLPIKLSSTPGSVRLPPPRLGEHTRRVLTSDLGLSDDDVSALAARGVVK
jgi:formyl-CoA transferase/CoA:oxalate CoA-transferase